MEYLNRKEQIIIKQNKIKEQIMIKSLNDLHFCGFVDEETKNRIRVVLQYVNIYNAKPSIRLLEIPPKACYTLARIGSRSCRTSKVHSA